MRSQIIGWFFCILFCSSMAHDWLRGQDSLLEAKEYRQIRSSNPKLLDFAKFIQSKIGNDDEPENRLNNLQLRSATPNVVYYCSSQNQGVFVLCNTVTKYALVIDIVTSRVLCCNGNNGTAVLININTGICYNVTSQSWIATVSIKIWLATCSLAALEAQFQNNVIDINNPGSTVSNLCKNVLVGLDADLGIQALININQCLKTIIILTTEIITCLNVNLAGLCKLTVVDLVTITNGGLMVFLECLRGLIDLCDTANLNVAAVVAVGVIIDIGRCLTASNGLACCAYVLQQIGAEYDLFIIVNVAITNITNFLRICTRLGGNVDLGGNGALKVCHAIYALVAGSNNVAACLLTILNVCAKVGGLISIDADLDAIQAQITQQISVYNNQVGLAVLINLITSLKNNTCKLLDVDISLIISTICGGVSTSVLDLVISCVKALTKYTHYTVQVYYATLLRCCLGLLDTIPGRLLINVVIPNLNVPINYTNPCLNLLAGVVAVTLGLVLLVLSLLGLVSALGLVPTCSTIYNACYNSININVGLQLNGLLGHSSANAEVQIMSSWVGGITNLCD